MAFTGVGSFGTVQSKTANQASLVLTTTATLEAGNFAVLAIASDNTRTTDGDDVFISGITDDAGNTWSKAIGFANGQGGAGNGASVEIWSSKITNQLNSGSSVTIAFNNTTNRDATAASGYEFSVPGTVNIEATNTLASDNQNDPGSLDATTSNIACLRVRAWAYEYDVSAFTPTASWTGFTNIGTTGGSAIDNMGMGAEFIISTATGAASAPDVGGSQGADSASVYVAFSETAPVANSGAWFLWN